MNWLTTTNWSQGSQEISWKMKQKPGKTLHPAGQRHWAPGKRKDSSWGCPSAIRPWRLKRLPERDHRSPEAQCSCRCLPSEWPQERRSVGKGLIHKERKETNEMACDIYFPLTLFRKTPKGKGFKSQKCKYFYKIYVLVLFWPLTKRWQLVYLICKLYMIFFALLNTLPVYPALCRWLYEEGEFPPDSSKESKRIENSGNNMLTFWL